MVDRPVPLFVLNHRGSGVAVVGATRLPIGCPSTKGLSFSPRRRKNSLYWLATVGLNTLVIDPTFLIPQWAERVVTSSIAICESMLCMSLVLLVLWCDKMKAVMKLKRLPTNRHAGGVKRKQKDVLETTNAGNCDIHHGNSQHWSKGER